MKKSRALIEKIIAEKQVVYGVTTGVGSLSTEHIDPSAARELQLNVVRSHSCGIGEPLSPGETRGLLLLRANTLARGLSGVRPLIAETLCAFLNHGVHPVVPRRGSVGASGDLAPLAHVALALVGEGDVVFRGRRQRAAAALKLKCGSIVSLLIVYLVGSELNNSTRIACRKNGKKLRT